LHPLLQLQEPCDLFAPGEAPNRLDRGAKEQARTIRRFLLPLRPQATHYRIIGDDFAGTGYRRRRKKSVELERSLLFPRVLLYKRLHYEQI
jgi:hypothetical protein